jgi:hypothetical protein
MAFLALSGCESSIPTPPAASRPPASALTSETQVPTFPIEVLGAAGTTRSLTVQIPELELQSPLKLWLQVHNLSYEDKASIRFNQGAWISLNNASVFVEGLGRNYGGIGGAFATLPLRIDVPAGALVAGGNTIEFRFNQSDGRSIGFRVLKLDFLRLDGSRLFAGGGFTQEDPNTWQPPYADLASIAEGQTLWRTASLVQASTTPTAIQARCMDCHTQDGRDLKYFNYSNHAIIERSKFHGLTEEQGRKIASYIRTLAGVPNPGRPWNPPYQPGPGVDLRPVESWAAGAGIDQVLVKDRDILEHLFPNGITKDAVLTTGNLSTRSTPIHLQLPDWNHWLPTIHPKDAWGSAFTDSNAHKYYNGEGGGSYTSSSMRERARQVKADGYTTYNSKLFYPHREWGAKLYEFISPRYPYLVTGSDVEYGRKVYSTALWAMVKMWEIMQEFGLEGHQKKLFASSREDWGWMGNYSFDTSPHLLGLLRDKTGINNNTPLMFVYFSAAWYQLSLVLYHGNHSDGAYRNGQRPIDWPYTYGFLSEIQYRPTEYVPGNGLLTLWLVKAMQVADNTLGPSAGGSAGWAAKNVSDLSRLVVPGFMRGWADISQAERAAILQALLSTWWDKTRQYPVSEWLNGNGNGASTTETINAHYDGSLGNKLWYMLPHFKHHGVDPALVDAIADWAQTIWTQADWSRVKNATCLPYQHYYRCTSEVF